MQWIIYINHALLYFTLYLLLLKQRSIKMFTLHILVTQGLSKYFNLLCEGIYCEIWYVTDVKSRPQFLYVYTGSQSSVGCDGGDLLTASSPHVSA